MTRSRERSSNRNNKVAPKLAAESAMAPGISPLVLPAETPPPGLSPSVLPAETPPPGISPSVLPAETPPPGISPSVLPAATALQNVSGAITTNYEFPYVKVDGNFYYNGTADTLGRTEDVSFVLFDEAIAKKIYVAGTAVGRGNYDERVIKPRFITYNENISKYIFCYDRFDSSLKVWLRKWLKSHCVKDSSGLPHREIQTEISMLLKGVSNIQKERLRHLPHSDISNYVVINDNWYIINISGTLVDSDSKWKSKIMSDFRDFREMLKENVLTDESWQERNDFFTTFNIPIQPNRLDTILVDHVFTKSPCERLRMFSVVRHGWREPNSKFSMLYNAILNGSFDRYTKGGWDNVQMGSVLSNIYNYQGSHYKGHRIQSLLDFLRNVYEHYEEHNGNVVDIEKEVRQLWPGLLEKLLHYY